MIKIINLNENYLLKLIKGPTSIKTGSGRNDFALRVLIKLMMFCFKYHSNIILQSLNAYGGLFRRVFSKFKLAVCN